MPTVILFDGECNLCNGAVQFIIKRDNKGYFKFASLQSEVARQYLPENLSRNLSSIVLVADGKVYTQSTAALKIGRKLSGAWPLLYGLMVVPRFIRDFVYRWIAKNRYKWFGKADSCWVATPDLKSRFLT